MSVNIRVGTLRPANFVSSCFGKPTPLSDFLLGKTSQVPPLRRPSNSSVTMPESVGEVTSEVTPTVDHVVTSAACGATTAASIVASEPQTTSASIVRQQPQLAANLGWTLESERRQSFFLEWRITDERIASALADAQRQLLHLAGGDLVVLQSCAVDNLNITLNELTISTESELKRCADVLNRFMTERVPALLSSAGGLSADLKSIHNFNNRVFFAPIEGPGALLLGRLFNELQELLTVEKFNVKRAKGDDFAAHITLGKLAPGKGSASKIHSAIEQAGLANAHFGSQPVSEVVLCVKRLKHENTPPVLLTFNLGQ